MNDPYRDQHLSCPACRATLRELRMRQAADPADARPSVRWVCDACDGILLALADLAGAIHDLTSITPSFEYRDEAPGARGCPHCARPMIACKLTIVLEHESVAPRPTLDRCDEHGLWFDGEELAGVFEKVAGKGYGGGVGRRGPRGGRGGAIPTSRPVWEWEGSLGTKRR